VRTHRRRTARRLLRRCCCYWSRTAWALSWRVDGVCGHCA
jgi:hypothetical protein